MCIRNNGEENTGNIGDSLKNQYKVNWIIGIVIIGTLIVSLLLSWKSIHKGKDNISPDKATIKLKIWHPWSGKGDIFQNPFFEAVEEFNTEQKKIYVEIEGFGREIYRERLPFAVASNDTPDIYYCYTGGYLKNIAYADKILPIDDYLDRSVYKRIDGESLKSMMIDNNLYGLSFEENAGIFFVNNDLFEKYGLNIPHTWEELLNVSSKFSEYGLVPMACSNEKSKGYTMYLEALNLYTSGQEYCTEMVLKKPIENIMNSEGSKRYELLVRNGILGSGKESYRDVEQEFYLSKIPMYYTENEIIGTIIRKNCPLYGKVSIEPFPVNEGFQEQLIGGVTETFVINKNTKHPNEAVKAMEKITENFSYNISKIGAGVSTWKYVEEEPEEELYKQAKNLIRGTDKKMPYWEIYLEGKKASEFLNMVSEDFFELCS